MALEVAALKRTITSSSEATAAPTTSNSGLVCLYHHQPCSDVACGALRGLCQGKKPCTTEIYLHCLCAHYGYLTCAVTGKVQAMKDVAAEAEEDRLFEEDRGGSESGAFEERASKL